MLRHEDRLVQRQPGHQDRTGVGDGPQQPHGRSLLAPRDRQEAAHIGLGLEPAEDGETVTESLSHGPPAVETPEPCQPAPGEDRGVRVHAQPPQARDPGRSDQQSQDGLSQ